jgi:long-chain acyl-CoA synthetase
MKGYYNNGAATKEAIDAEGWFHTGDIGDIDADGYLRITDRKKELIVTAGGKKIVPQPIQNLAKQSRFVADALIIGDKRPFPIMMVVPNFSTLESWAAEEGIRWSHRSELVGNPKVSAKIESEVKQRLPKKFLILDREFDMEKGEVTPKLSIKRRVVEQNFSEGIEALYEGASAEPGDR